VATILVADDNSNIQKMVTLALKDQGIEVFAVGNGEAAVRKLPDVHPDLVLADIFMPVRNGYEVCEFVKGDVRYAHIPVILLVGAFDPFDEREAQRVGADGVLKKPFVPPDPLITMVKSVLARIASDHAVPVGATVGAPASTTVASNSAPTMATAERESLPEPPAEEFVPAPPPLTFTENESPLAFSELLEAPAVETDPDPVGPERKEPILPATWFGEMRFWHSPSATEEVPAQPEAPAWTRPEPSRPLPIEDESVEVIPQTPVAAEPPEGFSPPVPVLPVAPPSRSEVASAVTEWVEAAHSTPGEPPAPAIETCARGPEAAIEPIVAEPSPVAPAKEAAASGWQEPVPEPLHEWSAPAWSNQVAPSFASEPAPPAPAAEAQPARAAVSEHAVHQAVQSFEVPPQPSAELVDRVVARVIERMQPQILDIVTREILKPVVEALVRRELEKR
jgi:CheY-like chemotaxis protein